MQWKHKGTCLCLGEVPAHWFPTRVSYAVGKFALQKCLQVSNVVSALLSCRTASVAFTHREKRAQRDLSQLKGESAWDPKDRGQNHGTPGPEKEEQEIVFATSVP